MKDLLTEKIKLEEKINYVILLEKYYRGKITWIQFKEESGRIKTSAKALLEESDVKPSMRNDLENQDFPLTNFMNNHKK